MYAYTILTSCLLLLAAAPVQGAVVGRRAPDATAGRLAHRAVVSGGSTCYFSCPPAFTTSAGTDATLDSAGGPGVCIYEDTEAAQFTCNYADDGSIILATSDAGCPAQADDAGCVTTGDAPPNGATFRRSNARRAARPLTRSQQIIKARQYKPKKVARSQK